MSPRVSVLIPAYNCGRYIGAAIESVLCQTFQNFELIVVDDGSEDETATVAQGYARVRYFHQPHSGISAARNRALQEAAGELIAFLDADDLWMPDKLEKQVAYLDAHPECEILFCLYRNFSDIPEAEMTPRQRQVFGEGTLRQYVAAACVRAELFKKQGEFNVKYRHGEDTEWTIRLQVGGTDLGHCLEDHLYLRRIHNDNISLTHQGMGAKEKLTLFADAIRRAKKMGTEKC